MKFSKNSFIFKSLLILPLTMIFILSFSIQTNAYFKDIKPNTWYYDAINELAQVEVLSGVGGELYLPNKVLTRAEAAVVFAKAFQLNIDQTFSSPFRDVSKEEWYYQYIGAVSEQGFFLGYNYLYRPNDPITRSEFVTVLLRALNIENNNKATSPFEDISNHFFEREIKTAYEIGLTNGYSKTTFGPDRYVSRAEAAEFLYKDYVFPKLPATKKNLIIKSIEATTSQVSYEASDQELTFTINGKKFSIEDLKNAGFEVSFVSSKDIFDTDKGTESSTGVLSVSKLQTIYYGVNSQRNFSYQVIVKNDKQSFQSSVQKVEVLNYNRTASQIDDYDVQRGESWERDIVLNSDYLVIGEKYHITNIKGRLKNGQIVNNLMEHVDKIAFYSDNPNVAIVNVYGEIIPISKGNVNILISTGDVNETISFNVERQKRIPSSLTSTVNHIKMTSSDENGKIREETITLTLLDQYGDPVYNAYVNDYLQVKETTLFKNLNSSYPVSIRFNQAYTNIDGTLDIVVQPEKGSSGYGNIKIYFTKLNKIGISIGLTVAQYSSPAFWEFNTLNNDGENILDRDQGTNLTLRLRTYDERNIYLGDHNFNHDSITVISSDPELVQIETSYKDIFVTLGTNGLKTGKAAIIAYNGSIPIAHYDVHVIDSKPTIELIEFLDVSLNHITNGPLYLDGDIINNITFSSGPFFDFYIYDENTVVVYDYYTGRDILTIKLISNISTAENESRPAYFAYGSNGKLSIENPYSQDGSFTVGDIGEIYLLFYHLREIEPVIMKTIKVDL